jgi:hypothetical protein
LDKVDADWKQKDAGLLQNSANIIYSFVENGKGESVDAGNKLP